VRGSAAAGTGRAAGAGVASRDGGCCGCWGGCTGGEEQAARLPRIAATVARVHLPDMLLILLEALGALAILVFIVWWTMFSGRNKGERKED
jgi:hypothetical protein